MTLPTRHERPCACADGPRPMCPEHGFDDRMRLLEVDVQAESKNVQTLGDAAQEVRILYTNWRGETAERRILPSSITFDATEWHPEPQWLLHAVDLDKGQPRSFALRDIKQWGGQQ